MSRLPVLAQPAWRRSLWGIGLAVALAVVAELTSGMMGGWLSSNGSSPVSPVLCAILIGVLWRNMFGVGDRWLPGLQWVANSLLKLGIALVGLRLTFSGIGNAAVIALPVAIGCISVALVVSLLLGKALGLSQPLRFLIAAGTAVCGCTAIVAVSPVIRARPAETGVALSCVVVLGCMGMFLYPWFADSLFHGNVQAAGVFLGTSIHDTSQVVGASLIYAQQFGVESAPAVATLTKMIRNLSLLALIPLFAAWAGGANGAGGARRGGVDLRSERSRVFPAFLIGFIAFALLRALGDSFLANDPAAQWWPAALASGLKASELILVCGMTALGLNVSFADLKGVGSRAFATAIAVAIAVALTSIGLVMLSMRLLAG